MAEVGICTRRIDCPAGCDKGIEVNFGVRAVLSGASLVLETNVIGAPVAEHVALNHPELID